MECAYASIGFVNISLIGEVMRLDASKPKAKAVLISVLAVVCVGSLAIYSKNDSFAGNPVNIINDVKNQTNIENISVTNKNHKKIVITKHKVSAGETLSAIAEKYNIDIDTLYGANNNINETIYPGQEINILSQKGVLYNVKKGDTLWSIARTFNVSMQSILTENNKMSHDIYEGEELFLPGATYERDAAVSRSGVFRFIWPTQGELTSPFGYRWGRLHAGIDIANEIGTPVRAAQSGKVIFAGWENGYGYMVMLEHSNAYNSIYGHLSDYCVEKGDYVYSGKVIGYMGNTGNSTGPHLHFEVRRYGKPINPFSVLP